MAENKKARSKRAATLMGIGFTIAAILVGAASLISGYTIVKTLLMVGWVILMSIVARLGYSISNVRLAHFLKGVAAVSLGGALSIGGGALYNFIDTGSVQLTIYNHCSDTLTYEPLDIKVAPNDYQVIDVPPVTVVIWQEGDRIFVRALGQEDSFPKNAVATLDGYVIEEGDTLTKNLADEKKHVLIIDCKPEKQGAG